MNLDATCLMLMGGGGGEKFGISSSCWAGAVISGSESTRRQHGKPFYFPFSTFLIFSSHHVLALACQQSQ